MNPLTVDAPGSVDLRALRRGVVYGVALHLKSTALTALYGQ
jgi:hypothetical protein